MPNQPGYWWWRNGNSIDMVEVYRNAVTGACVRVEHDYYDHAYLSPGSWWLGPIAFPPTPPEPQNTALKGAPE